MPEMVCFYYRKRKKDFNMKVRYIWNEPCTSDEFEREINEFIKGKNIIDIKLQPTRGGNDVPIMFALVMYDEAAN